MFPVVGSGAVMRKDSRLHLVQQERPSLGAHGQGHNEEDAATKESPDRAETDRSPSSAVPTILLMLAIGTAIWTFLPERHEDPRPASQLATTGQKPCSSTADSSPRSKQCRLSPFAPKSAPALTP
jgi:hypothetical protein